MKCGADRATSTASCLMENPADKDSLLLKYQLCRREDDNVIVMRALPQYYHLRYLEPRQT